MTEFQVNTGVIGNQSNSTVAIDKNGNFIISWTSFDENGFGGILPNDTTRMGHLKGMNLRSIPSPPATKVSPR
jgi:hypothetical protein